MGLWAHESDFHIRVRRPDAHGHHVPPMGTLIQIYSRRMYCMLNAGLREKKKSVGVVLSLGPGILEAQGCSGDLPMRVR